MQVPQCSLIRRNKKNVLISVVVATAVRIANHNNFPYAPAAVMATSYPAAEQIDHQTLQLECFVEAYCIPAVVHWPSASNFVDRGQFLAPSTAHIASATPLLAVVVDISLRLVDSLLPAGMPPADTAAPVPAVERVAASRAELEPALRLPIASAAVVWPRLRVVPCHCEYLVPWQLFHADAQRVPQQVQVLALPPFFHSRPY